MSVRERNRGFTLIELLLATALMSFLLIFVTASFIRISRLYTKGLIVRRMQEQARTIVLEVANNLRVAAIAPDPIETPNSAPFHIRVSGDCYVWNQYDTTAGARSTTTKQSTGEVIQFMKSRAFTDCGSSPFDGAITSSLIDERTIVQHFAIKQVNNKAYYILLVLSTDDANIVAEGENAACEPGVGSEYCDVVRYETVVTVRQ